jgi:hypothetical protein
MSDDLSNKKGVKLNNNNSMFKKDTSKPSKQEFEANANKLQQVSDDYSKRAADLSGMFKVMVNDKTLKDNKTSIFTDNERAVLKGLVELATEINTDSDQVEGMGSVSMITLIFRTMLIQRDRINDVDYKNHQLETKVELLSKKLNDLTSKLDKT